MKIAVQFLLKNDLSPSPATEDEVYRLKVKEELSKCYILATNLGFTGLSLVMEKVHQREGDYDQISYSLELNHNGKMNAFSDILSLRNPNCLSAISNLLYCLKVHNSIDSALSASKIAGAAQKRLDDEKAAKIRETGTKPKTKPRKRAVSSPKKKTSTKKPARN